MIEVELRYKLKDKDKLVKKLLENNFTETDHSRVVDHWYIPNTVKSRKEHDVWFDEERNAGIRIRENIDPSTQKRSTTIETKRLTNERNHNTFLETEMTIPSFKVGNEFLEMIDRKEFLTIDKERSVYSKEDSKIVIDSVKGIDFLSVEVELIGEERELLLKRAQKMANDKLGLEEKDRFEKSMTVYAMDTLARFD